MHLWYALAQVLHYWEPLLLDGSILFQDDPSWTKSIVWEQRIQKLAIPALEHPEAHSFSGTQYLIYSQQKQEWSLFWGLANSIADTLQLSIKGGTGSVAGKERVILEPYEKFLLGCSECWKGAESKTMCNVPLWPTFDAENLSYRLAR